MKKSWFILLAAVMLLTVNAQAAFALGPVAEVYYNPGTSAYDSTAFEAKLTEAIKSKLEDEGINPKYATIMDASANRVSVKDMTYVHSGYDTWYGVGSEDPEIVTPDFNHVQLTNEGNTLSFYGYTSPGYKDFMLTGGNPSGKKIITFDMDESKATYHSMEGGGFLINSAIDSDGLLSGYAIIYAEDGINVFSIDGVNAEDLHETTDSGLEGLDGVTNIGSYAKGSSTEHSIKIVATDSRLDMWDNGEYLIQNQDLPQVYGNEIGPIVSYAPHDCEIISIFTYDNMKLYTTSVKTTTEAAKDIKWEPTSPYRYVVDINDDNTGYLNDSLAKLLNKNSAQYVSVTSSDNETDTQTFIDGLNPPGGLLVDSSLSEDDIIEAIASRVANEILGKKDDILAIEAAEAVTEIQFADGDSKNSVSDNLTFVQDDENENVITTWSSDQPSIIAPDGTVTRPVTATGGTYVTVKATIRSNGLTSERTFPVFVAAADPAPLSTLSAVAGNAKATLNFPALVGNGEGDIVVEVSTDGTTFAPAATTEPLDSSSTSATVTGLKNGKTYYFRLIVANGYYAGESNVVQVKPAAPATGGSSTPETMDAQPIVTDKSNGSVVTDKITKLVGEDLKLTGKILTSDGQVLNVTSIEMNSDGTFKLPKLPTGEYTLSLNVIAPNGEKLAGPAGKLTVDENGEASLQVDLVDPFGTIKDRLTGQPLADVKMSLYWADTEENRSKGRTPGTLVDLPELANFAPNLNHNPQISSKSGEYGWMVYADADYYFTAEKDGYVLFDSRKDNRDEKVGTDSYVKGGVIHVGQTIVQFSFPMQAEVKESGNHTPYMVGFPDGSFHPEYGITRAEVAAILSRLYTSAGEKTKAASYTDVSSKHWAANAIAAVTQHHWMVGNGNQAFQPNRQVTRAEFAQILLNLKGWKASGTSGYADTQGHWADQAIATVKQEGLLFDFTEDNFQPDQALTRLEAVRIFNQLLNRQPWEVVVSPRWNDVRQGNPNYSDIMEASVPHAYELYTNGYEAWQ
ncbi:S-layer homology domain-containing protein [Cohnella sp. AR92]|uniref:S-layer homology domain-containing protein n=1 Tax=Cohnella sp. AR92 TaxID=648716 RepID=UPI000F8EBF4E|nr:S-layer homology domain-containing protein [Cohnella sp. AR92]RUS47820.1 S-layer homology domain-containing protein [Cohnella sp. AR92]